MELRFKKIRVAFIVAVLSAIVLLSGCSSDDVETTKFEFEEKFVRVPLTVVQRINKTNGAVEASQAVGEDFIVCDHHGGRFILADRHWNLKVLGYKKY